MSSDENYIVEQFTLKDSDISTLAKLLTGAFQEDEAPKKEGAVADLRDENFKLIFGAPSIDKETFVRARYKPTNEIVGFLGSIQKSLSIDGKIYKVSLPAWLSVHHEHRRKGLGTALGMKLFEVISKVGYDATVFFHDAGQHGKGASSAAARNLGLPMIELAMMNKFIVRGYDVDEAAKALKTNWIQKTYFKAKERIGKVKSNKVRLYKPDDIDKIFELSTELSKKNQISIMQVHEDLKWKLADPQVLCVVYEDENGEAKGFINAWEFLLSGFGNNVRFGWLDTIHTYNLTTQEVKDLANFLGHEATKRGWKGLQTPYIPYFDSKPFKKVNFIFFPKKVGLYLININNIPIPEKIESIYFEWR